MDIQYFPAEGRKTTLTIFCDGEPWRNVHVSIFGHQPSLPKSCSTLEDFAQEFFSLEQRLAKIFALRKLAAQNLPSSLLARALRQRLVSEQTIEILINEFNRQGYLNDQEWAASYVRYQTARKVGPRNIAQKLTSKGLTKTQFKEVLQEVKDSESQKEAVNALLITRYRHRQLSDFREKQKVIAALVRRGFDLSVILDCVGAVGEFE